VTQFKSIGVSILSSLVAGLLWIGPGAAYAAADDTAAPEDTFITPDTRVDRFAATVNTEPRSVIQFTGNLGTTIPGTRVSFTQHRRQAVLVTFVADWLKPLQE
jgi:hypothetical protein